MSDHNTVTMDAAGTSQTDETPAFTVDANVRPLIESFFKRVTEEQWGLLKVGSPDDATKDMLSDLLLHITTSMSKALLTALEGVNVAVSEERVRSSPGDTLPQSSAEVVDVKDQVQCVSSQRLTDSVVKEVAESANSALCDKSSFNAMVGHACKMLKAFKAKILCTPRPQKKEEIKLEDQSADIDDGRPPVTTVEAETQEKISSEDSFVTETKKAVQVTAVEESGPLACEKTRAEPVQDATKQAEENKMSVGILIEKLVSRVFRKANVSWTTADPEDIIKRLSEKTWAEVEGEVLYITPKIFKILDKAIFKDLHKKCGNEEVMLASMNLEEPAFEKLIASSVKHHLMKPPKKPSAIGRFMSSVGNVIFRRRNRVGVM